MAQLALKKREGTGTGSARAVRREGFIPGIIYGEGEEAQNVKIDSNEFMKLYNRGGIRSKVINLEIDGSKEQAIAREVQLHPVSDAPLHVDFQRLKENTVVAVEIPVDFHNTEKSPGIKRGGVLNIVRRKVELLCTASNMPEKLDVDLTGLQIGDSVHISQIKLPEGVEPKIIDRDFTVATIVGRVTQEMRDAMKAAEAEAEAAAEGADEDEEGGDTEAEVDASEEAKAEE